jgi:hypothetical protein
LDVKFFAAFMPKIKDGVLESNTQPQSIISKIKEDDRAKEEKLAIVPHMVITGVIFCIYITILKNINRVNNLFIFFRILQLRKMMHRAARPKKIIQLLLT